MSLVLAIGAAGGAFAAYGPVAHGPGAHRAASARSAALASADKPGAADLEAVTKTASSDTFSAAGQVITYTFDVTRTGNGTATGVTVTDSGGQSCYIGNIREDTTGSCWISYVTTPQDVANGQVQDTATVTSNNAGTITSNTVTVRKVDGPAVGLSTMPDIDSFAGENVPITYTYHVTNPGSHPLTDIRVRDTINGHQQPPGFVTCDGDQLAVGAGILECHSRYQTTSDDVDRGEVASHATVTAQSDGQEVTHSASRVVPFATGPAVGLSVIPDPSSFAVANTPIFYHYAVANPGDVPLSDIQVSDEVNGQTPLSVQCGQPNVLDAGPETLDCESEYTTTPADVSRGQVTNEATVTALGDGQVVTHTVSETVTRNDIPNVSIVKRASVGRFDRAGTEITYVYDVENDGNTPLTGVGVTDAAGAGRRDLAVDCDGVTALEPGERMECLAAYRTTAADVAAGQVSNDATVTGATAAGAPVENSTSLSIPVVHAPGISVLKTADPGDFHEAGTRVTFYYQVTNNGSVPAHSIVVTDNRLGRLSCPRTELPPGEHMVCTASHVITAADVAAGGFANEATAAYLTSGGQRRSGSAVDVLAASRLPAPVSSFLPEVAVTG